MILIFVLLAELEQARAHFSAGILIAISQPDLRLTIAVTVLRVGLLRVTASLFCPPRSRKTMTL